MPTSSVAVRSLALALLGLGAASATFAQGSNVTAFNPYSGVGLPGGPVPQYGPQAAYPIVDTVGPTAGGPAFNPWQAGRGVSAAYPVAPATVSVSAESVRAIAPGAVSVGAVSAGVSAPAYAYNPGAYLPAPPPGPIESRVVAIPELGTSPATRRSYAAYAPPSPPPVAPPVTAPPPVAARPQPVPTPVPVPTPIRPPAAPPPVATTPAPTAVAPTPPAVAPAPPAMAAAAPLPSSLPLITPRATGTLAATVAFTGQSAELNAAAKTDLDRLAKNLGDRSPRQIEVRAYASGADPDSRKVSLARALVVRSYLIDRGVKARIEIGAFGGDSRGGISDRVDILVPNS
ncbi:OmpA family protein [Reyranella sp.]|uniref:OmpA family protein n=1 Tax=Reyranella sp. TaxID=1929291 RepID=UPI0027315E2F|nr:OmpA family protein [Reyranella sp.]MDP2374632.1 OmpA family protein [Reyranella sp.]